MGFYIRKAFKTGPVRLNLSRGGLGLSAGVTGARLGLNTRGIYVHGGRHGLYYRKYLKQERGLNRKGVDGSDLNSGIVYLFRDTGVTFQYKSSQIQRKNYHRPKFPEAKIFTLSIQIVIFLAAITFFLSFFDNLEWMLIPATLIILVGIFGIGRNINWRNRVKNQLKRVTDRTETEKEFYSIGSDKINNAPENWKNWFNARVHAVIGEMAMRDEEIDTVQTVESLDKNVPVESKLKNYIRSEIVCNLLDEMLEDHFLSEDEENQIRTLIEQLNLPEDSLTAELHRLDHYSQIRHEIERPLEETDPGIPLVRGEAAFEVFENARLLKERVLNRFQRDRVQYNEMGYEIDSEGKLILTDRRLMIIERGTREYRLNRIVDITADPESGIVEIVLSNRKSPILITVQQPLVLAARLEKIYEEFVTV